MASTVFASNVPVAEAPLIEGSTLSGAPCLTTARTACSGAPQLEEFGLGEKLATGTRSFAPWLATAGATASVVERNGKATAHDTTVLSNIWDSRRSN